MNRKTTPGSSAESDAPLSKAKRTRARILNLAAEAFARHGYEGTSLNEVIRGSGLTKGAFYFHFKSKEDLALNVFRTKQAQLVARIRTEAKEETDALRHLKALLRIRARLLKGEPAFRGYLKLASELVVLYGSGSEFAKSYGVATGVFADIVRRGQREGVISKSIAPINASEFIFSVLLGADEISKAVSDGQDLIDRTERFLDFILAALDANTATKPRTHDKHSRRPLK